MNPFLTFSDGAKFAIVARNLLQGSGFTTDFSFWGGTLFSAGGIPLFAPHLMALFMRFFGTNDLAVISFSFTFYLFLITATFLLGKKIFGNLVGLLSALAVGSNINLIDYATSGASETLFAFEIVSSLYLLSFKRIWVNLLGFFILGLMYFTRPQAFIFIAAVFFFWIILRWGFKKGTILFLSIGFVGMLVDKFIIYPLSFKYPLTPIFMRGLQSILSYSSFSAVSDGLRGGASSTLSLTMVVKKVFYNLYNFYKAIPEIINPYLFVFFIVGLFNKWKSKLEKTFIVSTLFATVLTFLVTALTIPFYRYLHPVVPLIYIVSIAAMVSIVSKIYNSPRLQTIISLFLVSVFCLGQLIGSLFLDSRFAAKRVNNGKAPVYAELSYKLKEITNKDQLILTNLDTWGSWYGERKTVWFPLTVQMFLESPNYKEFDAIYLTSYKIDDENYYMGEEWRKMFDSPKTQTVLKDFKFVEEYLIDSNETYEKEAAKAVLFVRK